MKRPGIFNKVVSYATGLALIVQSGCVDTVNGVKIREKDKGAVVVPYNGERKTEPLAQNEEKKEDYNDLIIVGGVVLGVAALGAGSYLLYDHLTERDKKRESRQDYGGGQGPGDTGGQ